MTTNDPANIVRLNKKQLCTRLCISPQTLWRWYREGDFPKPHKLGQNRVWYLSDVERWERLHVQEYSPAWDGVEQDNAA